MARKRPTTPKPARAAKKTTDLLPQGYAELLDQLKERIRSAQLRAAIAVNRELVLLYWQIGREILTRQEHEGWGAKVIDRLAADLRRSFPEMTGLSPRNLKYMRAFGEAWPDAAIVQQAAAQIPRRATPAPASAYISGSAGKNHACRETLLSGPGQAGQLLRRPTPGAADDPRFPGRSASKALRVRGSRW
jgi:DUF1016 N-terminal domain